MLIAAAHVLSTGKHCRCSPVLVPCVGPRANTWLFVTQKSQPCRYSESNTVSASVAARGYDDKENSTLALTVPGGQQVSWSTTVLQELRKHRTDQSEHHMRCTRFICPRAVVRDRWRGRYQLSGEDRRAGIAEDTRGNLDSFQPNSLYWL
jgi:hypothetical protein